MRLIDLTLTILDLTAALDSGDFDDYTVEEAREDISRKAVFHHLERRGFRSMVGLRGDVKRDLEEQWDGFRNAYGGDEDRKWGIRNRGMCLLIAWTNEVVHQRALTESEKES